VELHNTYDNSGRCTVNDVRLKAMRNGKEVEERQLFTFRYESDLRGHITAVNGNGPDGPHRTTFNAEGYVTNQGTKTQGRTWERDGTNTISAVTVYCSGKKNVRVRVPVRPYRMDVIDSAEMLRACLAAAGR
jgi:hypothetical protein